MKKIGFSFLLFLIAIPLLSQRVKEFYNNEWIPCDSSKAAYYRLIEYDAQGSPIGQASDYYITGEKQWEGRFSFVDKQNKDNDISEGLCTWYNKNGKKSMEGFYVQGILNGPFKKWYDSGNINVESNYINDNLEGYYYEWYETGDLKLMSFYADNQPNDHSIVFCDEDGVCTRTFSQNFVSPVNEKKKKKYKHYGEYSDELWKDFFTYSAGTSTDFSMWPNLKNKYSESKKLPQGYALISTSDFQVMRHAAFPFDYMQDFAIDISFLIMKSKQDQQHGMVWGYLDPWNYEYFTYAPNGAFEIGSVRQGKTEIHYQSRSIYTDENFQYMNYLGLSRKNDSLHYSIGYSPVYSMPCIDIKGISMGFLTAPQSACSFTSLSINQQVVAPVVSPDANVNNNKIKKWKGTGSGFIISTDGYIVTNHHVIAGANEIEVDLMRDGNTYTYSCELFISDQTNDLAIIRITDPKFQPLPSIPYAVKSELADVGTPVFALGYPLAFTVLGTELKFTEGTINSRTGKEGLIGAYQISAPVQPGNSGGPLFDYQGNIIGVINEKLFYADNVAFAIKSNFIQNLSDLMPKTPDYPTDSKLKGLSVPEQIKIIRNYIPLIKVK
jgi:antitoxin component YwqK of YwqJK toxin-antitoxin module